MAASSKTSPFGRVSVAISATVALVAAVVFTAFAPSHVYSAVSGYSGHRFWLAFRSYPTEKQLFEAVFAREPSLSMGNDRLDEVQATSRGFVSGYPKGDLVMVPFASGKSPDAVFSDGSRVKGVWLTEPATRTEFPAAVVSTAYFVAAVVVVFVTTWLALCLIRWVWYFALGRVTEVSSAVRRSGS